MEVFIIRVLLFAIPIVILPFGASYFEVPKVIVAELGIQILFLIFLWRHHVHKIFQNYWPFILILFLSVVDTFIVPSPTGFFGNVFRLQGTFLLWNLILFSIIVSYIDNKKVQTLFPFITLISLFGSLFVYGQNGAARAIGTLGEPNALAATAVFCFPFVYCQASGKNKVWLQILAFICIIAILVATRSRSASIGLILEVFIIGGHLYAKRPLKELVIAGVLILCLAQALPLFEKNYIYENRVQIWISALYGGMRYPLHGWGFGNAEKALSFAGNELSNNLRYVYVDSAHNLFLDWWLQGGLVGLSTLLYLIFNAVRQCIIKKDLIEIASFVGILATLLFNPTSIAVLLAFWWLIGRGYRIKFH